MSASKTKLLWQINVVSFLLFFLLFLTGLANWLVFPGGHGAGQGLTSSFRGFLCAIHRWSAVGFMVLIAVHMALHWDYLKKGWEKYGFTGAIKQSSPESRGEHP